jgi:predicted acetyltransferase
LSQALVVARSQGVDRVLVTCFEDNAASARVIEKCGGVLEDVITIEHDARGLRRYWIE